MNCILGITRPRSLIKSAIDILLRKTATVKFAHL